jgi:hypothetical protein
MPNAGYELRRAAPSAGIEACRTVSEAIAAMAFQNKAVVYGVFLRTTAAPLRTIAADPNHLGVTLGFLAVLHAWGQTLGHHHHPHCVVPGGGLAPDGQRWIRCRPGFFLPVRVLSCLFRRLRAGGFSSARVVRRARWPKDPLHSLASGPYNTPWLN